MQVPEQNRVRDRRMRGTEVSQGNEGVFVIPHWRIDGYFFSCEVSARNGWEHVAVTVVAKKMRTKRSPTFEELCFVKDQFWPLDESAAIFFPAMPEDVKMDVQTLHLWRPIDFDLILPQIMTKPETHG